MRRCVSAFTSLRHGVGWLRRDAARRGATDEWLAATRPGGLCTRYVHARRWIRTEISVGREQARIARAGVNVVNFLRPIDSAVNGSSDFSRSLIRKRMLSDAYRRVSDIFTGVIDYRAYGESFALPALECIRLFKFDNRVTEAKTTRELTPRSTAILFLYFCIKYSFCDWKEFAIINCGLDSGQHLEITI